MATDDNPVAHLRDQIAFRWADYDTPLWARRNTRAGRWNRALDGSTQYWCLDPHGPWAELIRQEELSTEEEVSWVRQRLWVARWNVANVADMATFEKVERWGVNPDVLVDDDHRRCRDLADRLRADGYAGVLCPSAALPDTTSLVVFGRRVDVPWEKFPRLASRVPVAEFGRSTPPAGLLERVRQRGDQHSALVRYKRAKARAAARVRKKKHP